MSKQFNGFDRNGMRRFAMSILLLAEATRSDSAMSEDEKSRRLDALTLSGSALAVAYMCKYPGPEDDV